MYYFNSSKLAAGKNTSIFTEGVWIVVFKKTRENFHCIHTFHKKLDYPSKYITTVQQQIIYNDLLVSRSSNINLFCLQ